MILQNAPKTNADPEDDPIWSAHGTSPENSNVDQEQSEEFQVLLCEWQTHVFFCMLVLSSGYFKG